MKVALYAAAGLVGRGDDPRTGSRQLTAALGVRDRHSNKLGEGEQALLGAFWMRPGLARERRDHAPQSPLHDDGAARRGADPVLPGPGRRRPPRGLVAHPGWLPGPLHTPRNACLLSWPA